VIVEPQANIESDKLRSELYQGSIFMLPKTAGAEALVRRVRELVSSELATPEIRTAPAELPPEEFFLRMGRIRKALYTDETYQELVRAVLGDSGFDPEEIAFDPLRLRVVMHNGHLNERAKPVYYPHRDTWYGHPQGILTWWIPLDDLEEEETFVFHPQYFNEPVPNDSEIFDYDAWVAKGWGLKIGWQDIDAGKTAKYPQASAAFVKQLEIGRGVGFACKRAQNLIFAGAQLHQTRPQSKGLCRYSLDFRIVHLGDHEKGLGAPNVDNRSQGCALPDYAMPRSKR
jgi:hypothetical protein